MATQWFCRMAGAEIGPLSSQQVKMMVANGRLLPSDAIRQGDSGPWFPAARVKGLFPAGQSPGGTPAAANSPARRNGHAVPMAQETIPARPAANGAKKASNGQPAPVRATRPIVVPAGQPRQPRQAAPTKMPAADEFPDELIGGIPEPKRGLNFDNFAIDTTPVKVTGRKSSRVSGMTKAEHTKVMRIMAAAIGGALVLSAILITIAFLTSRSSPATGSPAQPADASSQPEDFKPANSAVAVSEKLAKADGGSAAAADKPAAEPGKSAPAKGRPDTAAAKHRPAAKSPAAQAPKSQPAAKAEGAAAVKTAGKAADPNKPVGPNDPPARLDYLPPDN